MKESDAKNMKCPHHYTAQAVSMLAIILRTPEKEQVEAIDQLYKRRIIYCDVCQCPMWESVYEKQTQETHLDDPSPGPDWHKQDRAPGQPKQTWFRWVRTTEGDCGLKSKEQGCFYP